jgi:hypothetical protein
MVWPGCSASTPPGHLPFNHETARGRTAPIWRPGCVVAEPTVDPQPSNWNRGIRDDSAAQRKGPESLVRWSEDTATTAPGHLISSRPESASSDSSSTTLLPRDSAQRPDRSAEPPARGRSAINEGRRAGVWEQPSSSGRPAPVSAGPSAFRALPIRDQFGRLPGWPTPVMNIPPSRVVASHTVCGAKLRSVLNVVWLTVPWRGNAPIVSPRLNIQRSINGTAH